MRCEASFVTEKRLLRHSGEETFSPESVSLLCVEPLPSSETRHLIMRRTLTSLLSQYSSESLS